MMTTHTMSRRPLLLGLALAIALVACADQGEPTTTRTGGLQLVVLSASDSLRVGQSMALSLTRLNATRADTEPAQWSVAPPALASITQRGVVTGLAVGTVYVSARVGGVTGGRSLTIWAP